MKKIMGKFIIKPQTTQNPRMYDDAFLWKSSLDGLDVYVMLNHRLSLWCWLQCKNILNKEHSLVFVDYHCDACEWFNKGEPECLQSILSDFGKLVEYKQYNKFQCDNKDSTLNDRPKRSCITWSNFVYLAIKANLFKKYYIYSSNFHEWKRVNFEKAEYNIHENPEKDIIKNLESNIKDYKNKCIIDIDLDFFDKIESNDTKNKILEHICKIIEKYKKNISCITIAITDLPTYNKWQERQTQLKTINTILNLDIPIPILTDEEIKIIESNIR